MGDDRSLIDQQIDYYRARAGEYDQAYSRSGRYDRGEARRRQWLDELASVERQLVHWAPRGRILELAAGTGMWTEKLVPFCSHFVALDASPEVLLLNRARVADERVEYVSADVFSWEPAERADFVFFGFWLSHVPPRLFDAFWALVARCLEPGGRVAFVDSAAAPGSAGSDAAYRETRTLDDGREFEIAKVLFEPARLEADLAGLGWTGRVERTEHHFVFGCLENLAETRCKGTRSDR